jgi:rhamnosyltransferase
MEVSGFLSEVLFVIVLYKERLADSMAFKSLEPLMKKYPAAISVFVYDNSEEALGDLPVNTRYVHDPGNSGVSRAYNSACLYAKEKGLRFLLLMDQDSIFPESIFKSYSDAVETHPDIEVFAPIARDHQKTYSPFRFIHGRGVPLSRVRPGVHILNDIKIINSGALISVNAFEKSGGYDERFQVDFSDIVFCDRLANKNFPVCMVEGSIIHQHSSSSLNASQASKNRFDQYLQALALYKTITKTKVSYWWGGFPRAAKLSAKLRDRWFLQRFFAHRI